jgi:hypothetical protein
MTCRRSRLALRRAGPALAAAIVLQSAIPPFVVPVLADSVQDRMVASTVRVINMEDKGSGLISTGSGVLIGGGRFVVTNWHVVVGSDGKASPDLMVLQKSPTGQLMRSSAIVTWTPDDKARDVAILSLAEPWTTTSAIFADGKRGDEVRAVGFPGVSDALSAADADLGVALEPTLTAGSITRTVDDAKDLGGAAILVHQAPINPGNSGGPLFDRCGSLVGINKGTLLQQNPIDERASVEAQGSNLAVSGKEIQAGMRDLHLPVTIASHCDPGGGSTIGTLLAYGGIGTAVLLSGVAVALSLTTRGRAAVQKVTRPVTRMFGGSPSPVLRSPGGPGYGPPVPPAGVRMQPRVRCLAGEYQGQTINLDAGPLLIGRDPLLPGLVFLGDQSASISKRHCEVRFDAQRRAFIVTDLGSSNGTFMDNGVRLTANVPQELPPGSKFYLVNRATTFAVEV